MARKRFLVVVVCAVLATTGLLVGPAAEATVDPPGSVGRPVYVTNTGQGFGGPPGPHNVSIYTVGANGALNPLGDPVPTGVSARGIVFRPDGRNAYVVARDDNAVHAYTVTGDGGLVPLGKPVKTRGKAPFGIAMAPDGRTLYTANQDSGTVSVFAVQPYGTLALRGEPVRTGFSETRNVAVSPDGRFLFASHGAPGDQVPDVIVTFDIRPDGTLGRAHPPVTAGAVGAGMGISPDGRFLYIACQETHDVHGFRIGADGSLSPVPGSPFAAPKTAEGVAMAPDGSHLYVASVATLPEHSPEDDGVWTFAIGDDGALTQVGPRVEAGTGPVGITTTPDGRWLYASNFFSNNVSGFAISSGLLREVAGSPFPSRGKAPAFDAVAVLPNQGPVSSFSSSPRPAGQPTQFDATPSADRDGRIARYDWIFGDGTVLRDGGPRPAHIYQRPGTFVVTLVVTDDEGCSTTQVFTGRTTLCNGSPAGRSVRPVTIPV